MQEDFYTVREVAQLKQVARSTIYLAIAEGRLAHKRILGRLAVSKSDALKWRPTPHVGRRKGTMATRTVKARISQSQKRRWAQRKAH